MARSFLTNIDLNKNQLVQAALQNASSAPSTPTAGQVYYDTVLGSSYTWNGATWQPHDASKSTIIPTTAIVNFATTVQGYHLNQFAVPTANVAMGGFTLSGLNTAPNAAGQAAEYSWVVAQIQSAAAGIASKPPAQCISTANITLSGLQTIDGYTTLANDRVLVAGQSTGTQNGIYLAAAGAWTRAIDDGPAPGELEPGAMWLITNGTANIGTQWRCSNTSAITVGTTPVTIVQFGAASVYSAGNGILFTGSVISAVANTGVTVNSSGIGVDFTVVPKKYSASIGDGSTTAIVVTHNLGTQDVHMMVRQVSSPYAVVVCDMAATSTNTATFTFNVAPTTNQYRVTVIG